MEDPEALLAALLAWAAKDPRVSAVVQTGLRARGVRVDEFSDLDIELIGPGWRSLAEDDSWFRALGDVLVILPFESDGSVDADPSWPTRLVVYRGGRKIDFTLASEEHISRMLMSTLDPLYGRGFVVHYDQTGLLEQLPASESPLPPVPEPSEAVFQRTVTEFWFEATQVPVYVARDDLWVAQFRQTTMREMLLSVLEWFAQTGPGHPRDTWHIGRHMKEWLPQAQWDQVTRIFCALDAEAMTAAHEVMLSLFETTSREVAQRLGFAYDGQIADRIRGVIQGVQQAADGSVAEVGE
ncbi:aminoglycoside 6-adenylyltransferase [Streptacidiphilus sp. MAP12-33]|uniref:aminoglycoside 6-adenylyltransferase n=1 Tax=Streptacidiphilus sp. MAP12-33 TaxID=3156266 RepID=UPI003514C429